MAAVVSSPPVAAGSRPRLSAKSTRLSAKSEQLTPIERAARGKDARTRAPRGIHGAYALASGRVDPVDLLERQSETRLPELVPLRYQRMLESPFRFFRGAAAVMAADLAGTPVSGIDVQLCGDAHLLNFRLLASPERHLVFDINDFDVDQLQGRFAGVLGRRMDPEGLALFARLCGATLARAHARSGDRVAIGAYLGAGDAFDRAIVRFAEAYADQNERDFAALAEAARSGRIRISTAGQQAGPGARRHRPSAAPAARVKAGRPRMPSAVGPRGGAGALSGTTEGGRRNRAADP